MESPTRLRALIASDGGASLDNLRSDGRIAVTITDILTFRSVQAKGRVTGGIEPLGPAEIAPMQEYDRRFGDALVHVGFGPAFSPVLRPVALVSVVVEVEELFDQSPGAQAGQPMEVSE
jgi:hypothetical protein